MTPDGYLDRLCDLLYPYASATAGTIAQNGPRSRGPAPRDRGHHPSHTTASGMTQPADAAVQPAEPTVTLTQSIVALLAAVCMQSVAAAAGCSDPFCFFCVPVRRLLTPARREHGKVR